MAASLSPPTAPAAMRHGARAPADEPVRILLVDDQPGRLLTYEAILEPLGEHLVQASSGREALGLLMQDDYALILLDVNMPDMDGFETASLVHQHPRYEKTPIIFVTAVNVTDMDRLQGYQLGAVDYVMVPVIPEILRSKVEVLVELYRKRRELQLLNASLAAQNQALQREKSRELQALNESLRLANETLASRNIELQNEVSERARAEERLHDMAQRKDVFLATLAHELRNPLAPLQNALAIRRLQADGAADPLHATMERQLALLVRLIDDLLDIARIAQGKLTLRPASVALADVLDSAVEIAQPLLDAGQHRFHVALPAQDVLLHADRVRLAQVFANLLNNAAKYSDPGSRIDLEARLDDARDEVVVTIRDTGIGLAKDQIEAVFDVFRQVDTTIERAHGGLGIGLTLVEKITAMHDGRVEVESAGLGQGCTFRVCLPRQRAALAGALEASVTNAAAADTDVTDASRRGTTRILVVDDNRDAADTLAMMVRVLGHEVAQVYDPLQVEAEVERFAPDLVFLDVGMPGRSGYDIARSLRQRRDARALGIVAVTGWGQPEDRERTRAAGFDEHLVKPPQLDAIRRLCAGAGRDADT
ncbi:response regulator [Luteimonas sp. MC1572]|uniref:response regulator n=1 Tax=Luteimonas sp. MC1572 TaxID=2799325 RepID=UPI0018F080A3|nr:response regulator [Luteimonas sp. MC1572]MBJ6982774.1 response regulator [Luteimonas sp. MC1572]QQO04010.1 response regulator [Luteimonas sp. MC1572]